MCFLTCTLLGKIVWYELLLQNDVCDLKVNSQYLRVCFYFEVKYLNGKSHPSWGLDDQMSFPALDETAECNTFCLFNLLMLIEEKTMFAINFPQKKDFYFVFNHSNLYFRESSKTHSLCKIYNLNYCFLWYRRINPHNLYAWEFNIHYFLLS